MQLNINDTAVEIVKKNIKHVHLSVYPPNGRVKVSAPDYMDVDMIRVYVISKLGWIRKQQQKLSMQPRETLRECIERESHYFKGHRYLLNVIISDAPPKVLLRHKTMELHVRPNTTEEKKRSVISEWYRQNLKNMIPTIIEKYEPIMGVSVQAFGVKKMKTKWGTCNPEAQRIWLNLELAKKDAEQLEYVVVHEMTHLLEPTHNERFVSLMNGFMPQWRFHKEALNRTKLGHEQWKDA